MTRREAALFLLLFLAVQAGGAAALAWAVETSLQRAQREVSAGIERAVERIEDLQKGVGETRERAERELRRFGLPGLPTPP